MSRISTLPGSLHWTPLKSRMPHNRQMNHAVFSIFFFPISLCRPFPESDSTVNYHSLCLSFPETDSTVNYEFSQFVSLFPIFFPSYLTFYIGRINAVNALQVSRRFTQANRFRQQCGRSTHCTGSTPGGSRPFATSHKHSSEQILLLNKVMCCMVFRLGSTCDSHSVYRPRC